MAKHAGHSRAGTRADVALVDRGLVESRTRAQALILAGKVFSGERRIEKAGETGKNIDFLAQEMNREANTLSSKSIVTETTLSAVELKVLIEQMREQIQNIE